MLYYITRYIFPLFIPSFCLFPFLSFLGWPLLFTHCRCRRLLLHLITLSDTHAHSPGRGVGSSQRLLHDNNKIHNGQTSVPSAAFEKAIPASKWPQACTIDHVVTAIGGDHFLPPQIDFLSISAYGALNIFKHVKPSFTKERRNLGECLEKFHTYCISLIYLTQAPRTPYLTY